MKHCFEVVLCGTGLLLTACNTFRAREIDLEKRLQRESKSYYRFNAGGSDGVVEYSSTHRDDVSSELVVRSQCPDESRCDL